jgi:hypothetical protein
MNKSSMQNVTSWSERNFTNKRESDNGFTVNFRKEIRYILECGHVEFRVGDVTMAPSKRLKCESCTKLASVPHV